MGDGGGGGGKREGVSDTVTALPIDDKASAAEPTVDGPWRLWLKSKR